MKLEEFRSRLKESKEFSEAKNELKLQFDLADAILKARMNKDWSQKQLAEAIGTKQANISRIEAGLANPTLNFIKKLANVLEINIEISFEKRVEVEYIGEPSTITHRINQLFGFPTNVANYSEFDIYSNQSKTQEKVLA